MIKTLYINSDGSIDVYDSRDFKLVQYTTIKDIHTILRNHDTCSNGRPSDLPYEEQVTPRIIVEFRISNSPNSGIRLPIEHLYQFAKNVKEENPITVDNEEIEELLNKYSPETPKPNEN